MKNSVLAFWKFLVTSGTAVSRISGKHCNVYSNFQKFLTWNFCCLIKKQQFPAIPETSQKMSKPFVPVLKFKEFLVEWKAPTFSLNLICFWRTSSLMQAFKWSLHWPWLSSNPGSWLRHHNNWIQHPLCQGATKVLSDSLGLVKWLVGLAFSYCSLPMGKHSWFFFSDDKLSFYTKACVAESPRENENVTRPNYCRVTMSCAAF